MLRLVKMALIMAMVLVVVSIGAWSAPRKVTDIDKLANNFVESFKAGNVDRLLALYAENVKVGTKNYNKTAIRNEYVSLFNNQKSMSIQEVSITGGLDSFHLLEANEVKDYPQCTLLKQPGISI